MTMLIPDQLRMTVAGMTCEACAVCVRQALEAAGARAVQVDVGRKEATFTLPSGVEPLALREAVRVAGYLPGRIEPRSGA
jgi:copper chaperone CopZ